MGKIALPLLFLALAITASAQTNYTFTEPVGAGRGTGTAFSVYQMPFGTAEVGQLVVHSNYACSGQSAPFLGYVFVTVNGVGQPCAPVTSATFGPNITTTTNYGGMLHYCTGPGSVNVQFTTGSMDLTLNYYWGYSGGRVYYTGCFRQIAEGTMTLN
jgi:hypothetical protein